MPSDWSVVKLKNGALPAYDETMEYMAAYDQLPARIDGKETALTPLIPDGLLLSVTPQRDGFLYRAWAGFPNHCFLLNFRP